MKLGGKSKDVDSFVDQLKSEGENVIADTSSVSSNRNVGSTKTIVPSLPQIKAEKWVLIIFLSVTWNIVVYIGVFLSFCSYSDKLHTYRSLSTANIQLHKCAPVKIYSPIIYKVSDMNTLVDWTEQHQLRTDKLAHIQVVINCRYSVAQMCTREDTLAHYLGPLFIDDVMRHNTLRT